MAITIDDVVYKTGVSTDLGKAVLVAGSDGTNPQPLTINSSGEMTTAASPRAAYEASLGSNNLSVATHYLPSATGISLAGYRDVSLSGVMATAGTVSTLTIEVRNSSTGTWVDVTPAGYELVSNSVGLASITDATGNFCLNFDNLNVAYVRVALVIDNATNTNELDFRAR